MKDNSEASREAATASSSGSTRKRLWTRKRLRAWAKRLALVMMSTLFAALLAEVALRLVPEGVIAYEEVKYGDELLGIPPAFVIGDDFPHMAKPKRTFRIAVLGDSHTVQIGREKCYATVLGELLTASLPKDVGVEVHNAGGSGHSLYQYFLSLRDRLVAYNPDLVIVAPYIGNDFMDLYRCDDRPQLVARNDAFEHRTPVFYKYCDPQVGEGWLVGSSRLLRFLRPKYRNLIGYRLDRVEVMWDIGRKPGRGMGAAYDFVSSIVSGSFVDQHVFRQSMNQILFLSRFPEERGTIDKVALRATEMMVETARNAGIRLLYAPIPTRIQVEPDRIEPVIEGSLAACGLDRSALAIEDELHASFTGMLDELGVEHISVRAALEERAREEVLYDFTYHIVETAHRIVARCLCDAVRPMVLDARKR